MKAQRKAAETATDENEMNTLDKISSEVIEFTGSVGEVKNKVVEFGSDMTRKTTEVVKEHPMKTAIGAGVVGFLVGSLVTRFSKSSK